MGFGIFGLPRRKSVEKSVGANEKSEKSRSGRFALRSVGSQRTERRSQDDELPDGRTSMGSVSSVKAAAQAKAAKPARRVSLTVDQRMSRPTRFVASSKKLGSGAYGAVVLGTDLCTGEQVAVKLIPDGRMKPASLEREVAMLRRLSEAGHPALLHFHAHVRPNEAKAGEIKAKDPSTLPITKPLSACHALVMEACRGGELFEYVVKSDGLAEDESAPLFGQLVDAVRAAHFLGIAHRDLKLENVLLCGKTGEPDARQIKLIDWGLAHQHAFAPDGGVVPEMLHSRCGSRSYMAPEVTNRQISSVRGYNGFLADVWSLGVCLFAIHLGFFPFEQADPEVDWRARRVVEAQRRGDSTMATIFGFYPHKPLSLSKGLVALLDRMLVFDPSRRASLDQVACNPWVAPFLPAHAAQPSIDIPATLARLRDLSTPTSHASGTSSTDGESGGRHGATPYHLDPLGDLTMSTTHPSSAMEPSRVERQDSASTAHSVGSSVGSSVVQSISRLRALEAANTSSRSRRSTHDSRVSPLPEAPEHSEPDAVQYAVAGGMQRETYPSVVSDSDIRNLSNLVGRAGLSSRRSGN